jgi:hypothetical protein
LWLRSPLSCNLPHHYFILTNIYPVGLTRGEEFYKITPQKLVRVKK